MADIDAAFTMLLQAPSGGRSSAVPTSRAGGFTIDDFSFDLSSTWLNQSVLVLAGCTGVNLAAKPSELGRLILSGCRRRDDTRTGLTGFGATLAQWKAAHTLDVSVPARNTHLPHVVASADGEDTWQVVTLADGRVVSYRLNVAPSSLSSAEARARRELPVDARVLWTCTGAGPAQRAVLVRRAGCCAW